ncbi:cytochrome P450-dit2, partial [Conoideocrella luteorostrata]
MFLVAASGLALLGACILALLSYFLFPLREVRGIPTIPFWVALLSLVKDVDQQDLFTEYIDQPLRKHGAVKLFFAAQWNVLVHRPAYIAEIFKHENIYQKSGNQKKIPHSVLASFLGDNIISSHGETWKAYQQVIKPGLQASPDLSVLLANAHKLRNILVEAQAQTPHRGI